MSDKHHNQEEEDNFSLQHKEHKHQSNNKHFQHPSRSKRNASYSYPPRKRRRSNKYTNVESSSSSSSSATPSLPRWNFNFLPSDYNIIIAPHEKSQNNTNNNHLNTPTSSSISSSASSSSSPLVLNPPSPSLEYQRARHMNHLRSKYTALCRKELDIPPPKESFNRWLFEQLSIPINNNNNNNKDNQIHSSSSSSSISLSLTTDPILRCPSIARSSAVLRRELLADVPVRLRSRYRSTRDLHAAAHSYLRGMYRLIDKDNNNDQDVDLVKKACRRVEDALSQREDDEHVLKVLRDGYHDARGMVERVESAAVDRVVDGIVTAAEDTISLLADYATADNNINNIDDKEDRVKIRERKDITQVIYADDNISVGRHHFQKLRRLFDMHHHNAVTTSSSKSSSKSSVTFPNAVYVLLRRYETFFGINSFEGSGFHAAAPESVFELLREHLSVSQECFASPLNCYFSQFFSAFPDTDVWFGSRGSFFDCQIVEGSFETGPPYTEEVMQRTADRLDIILEQSQQYKQQQQQQHPLSFVVFVPDWVDPPSPALDTFSRSPFLVTDFVAAGSNHIYITGDQHRGRRQQQGRRYYTVPHGTHVYILQNTAGKERWPVDDDLIKGLQAKLADRQQT